MLPIVTQCIFQILFTIPNFIFAMTFFGFFRALSAHLLGDTTPKEYGHLTLNPLVQTNTLNIIVFFGSILLSMSIFGESIITTLIMILLWTLGVNAFKEIPTNPNNFKDPMLDEALSLLTGPIGCITYSMLLFACMRFLPFTVQGITTIGSLQNLVWNFLDEGATIGIFISILTLIPLPPQTGGKIVMLLIPEEYEEVREWYAEYGMMLFLGLLFLPGIRTVSTTFLTTMTQGIKIMLHTLFFKII